MKSNWFAVGIIPALAIAMAGYFIGNIQKNAIKYTRSVEVKGLSERTVKADLAVWPAQIIILGENLPTMLATAEKQKASVIEFLHKEHFSDSEISVGATNTEDSQASPQYGTPPPHRYTSKVNIAVTTTDIEKMKAMRQHAGEVNAMGILLVSADTWNPVLYSYTKLNTLKPEMIEEAIKNAREVAQKFAQQSGAEVGAIKSANQGQFSIEDRPNTPEMKLVRVVSTMEYLIE